MGKAISGGYVRVADEAYNIKLDLLPIDLYIKLAATRSALRLLTTPIIRWSKRTSDSPLGKLSTKIEQQMGASISNLEAINTEAIFVRALGNTAPLFYRPK